MVERNRTVDEVNAAMRMVAETSGSPVEKAEMLMEIAMGMQQKPKLPSDISSAVALYEKALEQCPDGFPLLVARIRARMATAQMAIPGDGASTLEAARDNLEQALGGLAAEGTDEEIAEAEMNLGLVLQNLSTMHRAKIQDAIGAYQRALRTFNKLTYPQEFAILQSNLATAFLSIPFTDERSKMREALAVQSFEEALSVVNIIDHPTEYAMLQNNLGNALQYVSSSHRIENGYRAIEAYDEALKVRTKETTPSEYANTISNKANCVANLPDDPQTPDAGNARNLRQAIGLYAEAAEIFSQTGEVEKSEAVKQAMNELSAEASTMPLAANGSH